MVNKVGTGTSFSFFLTKSDSKTLLSDSTPNDIPAAEKQSNDWQEDVLDAHRDLRLKHLNDLSELPETESERQALEKIRTYLNYEPDNALSNESEKIPKGWDPTKPDNALSDDSDETI